MILLRIVYLSGALTLRSSVAGSEFKEVVSTPTTAGDMTLKSTTEDGIMASERDATKFTTRVIYKGE